MSETYYVTKYCKCRQSVPEIVRDSCVLLDVEALHTVYGCTSGLLPCGPEDTAQPSL